MSRKTKERPLTKTESYFTGNHWELPTDIGLVDEAMEQFKKKLIDAGWEEDADWLAVSFSEALINAIVHGNLEIKEKPETETWRDVAIRIQRERPTAKKVFVGFNIIPERISVTVRDEGNGFNVQEVADPTNEEGLFKLSGRGFLSMRINFDSVTHNEKGNEVTMIKIKN